jgi:hypothetical protein
MKEKSSGKHVAATADSYKLNFH